MKIPVVPQAEDQLAIKGKGNIDLSVGNTVLRLSDALYVPGLIVNLISTTRLWRNGIGVYFPPNQLAELSFNGATSAYADNIRDQFILRQSTEQSIFIILARKHQENRKTGGQKALIYASDSSLLQFSHHPYSLCIQTSHLPAFKHHFFPTHRP